VENENQSQNQNKNVLLVLWIALLSSQLIIIFVSKYYLFIERDVNFPPGMTYILVALAVAMLVFSRVAFNKANQMAVDKMTRKFNPQSFSFYIIGWAMSEAVTILGVMYGVLGGSLNYQKAYFFFLAGIFSHILQKPKINA
tara:strand:- start:16006 stop:16428 length:423 start_codon:yes stop_codon:yes gene_type:complete